MENKDEKMQIGPLRKRLGYKGRQPMETAWQTVFPGELLPEDYTPVSREKVLALVDYLAVPKQGRPGDITRAAKALWDEMADPILEALPIPAPLPEVLPTQLPTLEPAPQPDEKPKETQKPAAKRLNRWQITGLGFLMLLPLVVSFQNLNQVTGSLLDNEFSSLAFTVLLSVAPFVMTLVGVGKIVRWGIIPTLMIWEGFCNLTRIYSGLTKFETNALPTRFLQLVCDIFETGTKGTALALSAIMAALSLAIFFAGYIGLNKNR